MTSEDATFAPRPAGAVSDRVARFAHQLRFAGLGMPSEGVPGPVLDRACAAFALALNPGELAGAVVLEREADPSASDAAVSSDVHAERWIEALDASSEPCQWWFSSDGPPREQRFNPPSDGEPLLVGKPSRSCFFTSGGRADWFGMWSSIAGRESVAPGEIRAWRMTARTPPRQVIIDSATQWCELVTRFPRPTSRGLVLRWSEVARHVDAVTITARAVVSLDGVEHAFGGTVVAPTCWDTRTTVWLRWLLETETPEGVLV